MGRVTTKHAVLRVSADGSRRMVDRLAVEEPLEVRIEGTSFSVTMRTPGDDIDLVHGLLHSEQVIAAARDLHGARYCDGAGPDGLNTYNVLDVELSPGVDAPDPGLTRNVLTSSACGVCGTTSIDQVVRETRYRLGTEASFTAALVLGAPDRLRERQHTFEKTGGLHAAGLLRRDGEMLCVREDVGRHNAVDKVVGWALRQEMLPLSDVALIVSGRASFELTQKAVLAGIPLLVAVSAPSSLAVDLAQEAGLTLVGFTRSSTMNVYTCPDRIGDVSVTGP